MWKHYTNRSIWCINCSLSQSRPDCLAIIIIIINAVRMEDILLPVLIKMADFTDWLWCLLLVVYTWEMSLSSSRSNGSNTDMNRTHLDRAHYGIWPQGLSKHSMDLFLWTVMTLTVILHVQHCSFGEGQHSAGSASNMNTAPSTKSPFGKSLLIVNFDDS